MTPIRTRFSKKAGEWYDKWLSDEMFRVTKPDIKVTRIPIVGMRFQEAETPEGGFDDVMILEADPENRFDAKAIKVLYLDRQIGWVPRKMTWVFHSTTFVQEGDDLAVLPKVISGVEPFLYVVEPYG